MFHKFVNFENNNNKNNITKYLYIERDGKTDVKTWCGKIVGEKLNKCSEREKKSIKYFTFIIIHIQKGNGIITETKRMKK